MHVSGASARFFRKHAFSRFGTLFAFIPAEGEQPFFREKQPTGNLP